MTPLICPDIFQKKNVKAFFTQKAVGADTEKISAIVSVGAEAFYLPVQKHTDIVLVLENDGVQAVADAVVTEKKGIFIGVQVADCVPILISDYRKMVIAAVHAGWRGTAAQIIRKAIQTMGERFGSAPEDIFIACGPSIRGCCYEVGHEVLGAICSATGEGTYHSHTHGSYCVDLCAANVHQALSAGVPKDHVWVSNDCTFCNHEKYHSFRYHKNHAGRQAGFIGIF